MDTRTGEIISPEAFKKLQSSSSDEVNYFIPMELPPTREQLKRGKVGRNELCPCRSGKKFKRCHLDKNISKK